MHKPGTKRRHSPKHPRSEDETKPIPVHELSSRSRQLTPIAPPPRSPAIVFERPVKRRRRVRDPTNATTESTNEPKIKVGELSDKERDNVPAFETSHDCNHRSSWTNNYSDNHSANDTAYSPDSDHIDPKLLYRPDGMSTSSAVFAPGSSARSRLSFGYQPISGPPQRDMPAAMAAGSSDSFDRSSSTDRIKILSGNFRKCSYDESVYVYSDSSSPGDCDQDVKIKIEPH